MGSMVECENMFWDGWETISLELSISMANHPVANNYDPLSQLDIWTY
jgi:hypothetical protein